ncbi:hypothetical protein QYE76_015398, partial [Lolium multiflorum]
MTWHKNGLRFKDEEGRLNMGHPSDGKAWQNFDAKHPDKANDARNVRIAIATDGFNPYAGRFPCPVCRHRLEFIWLNAGRKYVAFDKHRKYLKRGHRFRGDKKNFTKGKVVREEETIPKFNGETVDGELRALQRSKEPGKTYVGYGETHNWTHVPGLTQLEYYKDLELPHNIDMMHTEKNVGESVFNTVLTIPDKTKDNVKARVDVENLCDRQRLHMHPPEGNRKNWVKPHANYVLDSLQKKEAMMWLKYAVMFPDGYCSNMSKGVNLTTGKVNGLKSHDYHIWIERLMPVMVRGYLPEHVWRVLAELSHFFRTREFKYIRNKCDNKNKIEACIAEATILREISSTGARILLEKAPSGCDISEDQLWKEVLPKILFFRMTEKAEGGASWTQVGPHHRVARPMAWPRHHVVWGPRPLSPPFLRETLRPEDLSHGGILTKGYSRLCGAENSREKRALRRAGIRRGNSLPRGKSTPSSPPSSWTSSPSPSSSSPPSSPPSPPLDIVTAVAIWLRMLARGIITSIETFIETACQHLRSSLGSTFLLIEDTTIHPYTCGSSRLFSGAVAGSEALLKHLEDSESEIFRKERDELEEIFLRQPILKHDLPVEDLGTTPPPKEDP